MKKQYLISLLGLAAISIPFGNSLFNSPSFAPSSSSTEEDSSKTTNYDTSENNLNQEEILTEDEYFNYSIEQVSTGENHSAAVVNDGTTDHLYTWGANESGQLGLGSTNSETYYNTPQEVIFYNGKEKITGDITDISMGTSYSAAVMGNNLYTWGANGQGQLGLGNNKNKNTPTEVTNLIEGNIEQISMGGDHSAAVLNNNGTDELYTWGANDQGQLGLGNNKNKNTPTAVTNLIEGNIEQISMGGDHSAAVLNSNGTDELYTWGANDQGQLGLGNNKRNKSKNTPQLVTGLNDEDTIKQISMGGNHSAAVLNNNGTDELYTWGANGQGQLGLGEDFTDNSYNTPQPVTGLNNEDNIEQISMGTNHSAAVVNGGTTDELYTWGDNIDDQLGLGDNKKTTYNTPQPVTGLNNEDNIEQISMGGSSSNVILSDENSTIDSLNAWGDNSNGKLGLGVKKPLSYNTPQEVWETPYIIDVSSEAILIDDDLDKVKIQYSFKTNLNVKDVSISINTSLGLGDKQTSSNQLDPQDNNEYNGEIIFENLIHGAEYTYTIELNYLSFTENEKQKTIVTNGKFSNTIEANQPITNESSIASSPEEDSTTSIKIEFNLNLGYDNAKSPYELEEIIIKDNNYKENDNKGHDNEEWTYAENNFIITDSNNTSYKGYVLVEDLRPNTNYSFKITFNFSNNGEPIVENEIKGSTNSAYEKSKIESSKEVKIVDSSTATIDYEYILGQDSFGDQIDEQLYWVFWINGGDVIAQSHDQKGTLIGTSFESGKNYNNTWIYAEDESGDKITDPIKVDPFETTSEPIMNIINYSTTSTSMTFDYEATPGKDSEGNPYYLTKIEIKDDKNVPYENISFKDELDSSGNYKSENSITINGLDSNTSYSGWKMYSTFENSSKDEKDDLEPIETDINRFETSLFSRNMIFIISAILLSIIFLLILIFLLWKIIKKSRTKNERVTESKGRNPNYWS